MLPDSERFNRGGMSLRELTSKINSSGASACIVISLYKGNPGSIQFISSSGDVLLTLKIESATLRREINTHPPLRATSIRALSIEPDSNDSVKIFAGVLSSLLGLEVRRTSAPLLQTPWPREYGSDRTLRAGTHVLSTSGVPAGVAGWHPERRGWRQLIERIHNPVSVT